jgi:hypothetical protein
MHHHRVAVENEKKNTKIIKKNNNTLKKGNKVYPLEKYLKPFFYSLNAYKQERKKNTSIFTH